MLTSKFIIINALMFWSSFPFYMLIEKEQTNKQKMIEWFVYSRFEAFSLEYSSFVDNSLYLVQNIASSI